MNKKTFCDHPWKHIQAFYSYHDNLAIEKGRYHVLLLLAIMI